MMAGEQPSRRVFGGLLLAGALGILLTGPAPQLSYASDTANYLSACGASAGGLILQRDYFSPIGPAAILPTVLAMRVHAATVAALAWGSALAWLGYGLAAWTVARPRMVGWLAAAFALFVAATATAPYTLDFGNWHSLSYGMLYNRLAWAAVCIAACPAFLPRAVPPRLAWAAAGHGACAAWLWLIKPNYVLIQVPLTIWAMVAIQGQRRPAATTAWFAAGAAAATLLVGICVPFDPLGYMREHFAMAHDVSPGLLLHTLARSLRENLAPVALLGAGWLIAAAGTPSWGRRASLLGLLVSVGSATFLANMTNTQFSEFPLWGALGWFLAAFLGGAGQRVRFGRPAAAAGVALGLAYAWQPLLAEPYAFAWKQAHAFPGPQTAVVASPAWSGMPMRYYPATVSPLGAGHPGGSAGDYAAWLNDGLALLARVRPSPGPVLCLDWDNPFPFALGARPVLGDQIAWDVNKNVSPEHHPNVRRLLDQAAVVMEPKQSAMRESFVFKRPIFTEQLSRDFTLAGESAAWRVWLRTPAGR
jgi:hypothetical protein